MAYAVSVGGVNPQIEDYTNNIKGEQYQDEFRISSQFPAKYQKIQLKKMRANAKKLLHQGR